MKAIVPVTLLASALLFTSCFREPRAAVTLTLVEKAAPADATVTIDEQYIGSLAFVAAHGVRLPVGEHRISIERAGYFPMDVLVVSDRTPIRLEVTLQKIPD